ncbi:MAG: ASKHA domain-containing protein, partial [bacterium]
MSDSQHRVTFQPQGRAVSVLDGTTVLEAAAVAGLVIDTPCGGAGTCGKCRVLVSQGATESSQTDRKTFTKDELEVGWRLACQNRVGNDMVVHVPTGSLFGGDHQIGRDSSVGGPAEVRPTIRKVYVELPAPTLEDPRPDLLRLEEKTGPFKVDVAMLRHAPSRLRQQGYKGTVVLSDHQLIDFEEGDTTTRCLGVAIDIGTTTMVASLLNLCDGRELATVSRMNPQVSFGDDVLSRIQHSSSCPHCLEELRQAVVQEISGMIHALCDEADIDARFIYEAAFAGNTTMQHLLCGVDPSPLGAVPFAPAYGRGVLLSAHDMGISINPHGMCYVFPVIGGFVGGDTVAGMLATRIGELEGPVLMVDIGTNGEIVLAHDGELLAASTAAGPAFEGARISCGMRGARGAIEKVVLDGDVHLGVIGNVPAIGICGSGLIDLAAELLRVGIVSTKGRLLPAHELPTDLSSALAGRVRSADDGSTIFVLTEPDGGTTHRSLSLTQRDIRELQLGSGAIRAGISMLLRKAGLKPEDLKTVLIAGGFGGFIRRDNAQRLGLLPPDVHHERIHYVGNVSLAG